MVGIPVVQDFLNVMTVTWGQFAQVLAKSRDGAVKWSAHRSGHSHRRAG